METKIQSVSEIKNLFIQELLNKVDGKVTKVSDNSVLNGVAYGAARMFQKGVKDVALLESELFPESAYGKKLDVVAQRYGMSPRKLNLPSSVYVKVVADPGATYLAESCVFSSTSGVTFSLSADFTIDENGFGYVNLISNSTGDLTNVAANTINRVSGAPLSHKYVNNDLPAQGGVDEESDEAFLQRIIQNFNQFSFETLDKLTYVLQKVDSSVLFVKKKGVDENGRVTLVVVASNGVMYSDAQLVLLQRALQPYLSLTDLEISNGLSEDDSSVVLKNVEYTYVDVDFYVDLYADVDVDAFRRNVQQKISESFDFRTWDKEKVEWEDLYSLVRSQTGVKTLPEQYFSPHADIVVDAVSSPRLRSFVMRDLTGAVIADNANNISPVYYAPDYSLNVLNVINNAL